MAFDENCRQQFQPATPVEVDLLDSLITADWELRRLRSGQVPPGEIKAGKLVFDWRKQQTTRTRILDRLPEPTRRNCTTQKCDLVFQHLYESGRWPGKSFYAVNGNPVTPKSNLLKIANSRNPE
jgi:hypothetical protein